MKAEIKLWHRPLKNGKRKLYIDCSFGAHKIPGNRHQEHKCNSLKDFEIDGKYWGNSGLKRSHPNYEAISHSLKEIRDRIEKAVDRYCLGQINRDQFIANISGKTDYTTIDDYIESEIKETRKGKTYTTYRDAFKTFKSYVGYKDKKMKFSDLNHNLLAKFKKSFFHSEIGKKNKSANSYNSYLTQVRAIYNDAYDNGIVYEKLTFNKKLRVKKTRTQWNPVSPDEYLKAIDNVNTLREWEALAMWLLAFCCRGLYWSDFTTMKAEDIKDNDLYNTWCGLDDMYILHNRHKTKDSNNVEMLIKVSRYPTLQLFKIIKHSFAKRMWKTRPDIVPDVNDWVSIFSYDLNADTVTHRDICNSYQKALRDVWKHPINIARKTFNNVAGECKITPKICDLLIGHKPDSQINMMSYTNYQTSEYAKQIEEAHELVLKTFRAGELADKLIERLEELQAIKSKKIPLWITEKIGWKMDSAKNQQNWTFNINEKHYQKVEKEIIETGFTEYFKGLSDHLDGKTVVNENETFIYNK